MNLKFLITSALAVAMISCMKSPEPYADQTKVNDESYFDFSTEQQVALTLNYGYENYKVAFEVYLANPYDASGSLKEGIKPFYGAFTDNDSQFAAQIKVPAYAKTIYVCTDYVGVPACLELTIENAAASYNYFDWFSEDAAPASRAASHTEACISIGNNLRTIEGSSKLYGLYNSYSASTGGRSPKYFIPSNSSVKGLYSQVANNTTISGDRTLGDLMTLINKTFTKTDNSQWCVDSDVANVRIARQTAAGEEVVDAHIDLTFLKATGGYSNAMGYYYFNSDKTLTAEEIKALPKYFVFPRTTKEKPNVQLKARLQFFGENYDQAGTDDFPAGYTIGWVLIPDIAGYEYDAYNNKMYDNANMSRVEAGLTYSYLYGEPQRAIYSNRECNTNNHFGCITVADKDSGKLIIGFEDQAFQSSGGDKSYEDILFYIDADPLVAVYDPSRPEMGEKPNTEILKTETTTSTIAFEDIWPNGGDYDLNDAILEHTQAITYNQNNDIKSIVDTFKATHCGAKLSNALGFVINAAKTGTLTSEDSIVEEEANQYIVFEKFESAIGSSVSVERTFVGSVDKTTYDASLNIFLVPDYKAGVKNRKEVHLPKTAPSAWMDESILLSNDDYRFIDKDGLHPFAICLSGVTDWECVTEMVRIGSENEYPYFDRWVSSKGADHADWYLHKK